jgi:hypothetical protein
VRLGLLADIHEETKPLRKAIAVHAVWDGTCARFDTKAKGAEAVGLEVFPAKPAGE